MHLEYVTSAAPNETWNEAEESQRECVYSFLLKETQTCLQLANETREKGLNELADRLETLGRTYTAAARLLGWRLVEAKAFGPNGSAEQDMRCRISERLRLARKARGISQRETARRSELSPGYVSSIENQIKDPSLAVLSRLAKVLQVDVGDLVATDATRLKEGLGGSDGTNEE